MIGVVVVTIAAVGGYVAVQQAGTTATNQTFEIVGSGTPTGGGVTGGTFAPDAVIRRTTEGYVPEETTIKQGDTVSFVNESGTFHWPASDVHPTHEIYADFDPRTPIGPDEVWSFTFTEAGTWDLHDHLRANMRGKIIVTPRE